MVCGMSRSETVLSASSRLGRTAAARKRALRLVRAALASTACITASPVTSAAQLPEWTLERTLTIGDPIDPQMGLSWVGRVIVDGDRLLVAQPMEQRVRIFSLTGDFLGYIGRQGEGPGEFQTVNGMGLHDGLVWVADRILRRVQSTRRTGSRRRSGSKATQRSPRGGRAHVRCFSMDLSSSGIHGRCTIWSLFPTVGNT